MTEIWVSLIGGFVAIIVAIITTYKITSKYTEAKVEGNTMGQVQVVYQKMLSDSQERDSKIIKNLEDQNIKLYADNIKKEEENRDLKRQVEHISNEMQKLMVKWELIDKKPYCGKINCINRIEL